MDVLVMLEEDPSHSPVLAHVNSGPAPLGSDRSARDVVRLYGDPNVEQLALALAAAVESRRWPDARKDAIWHLGVWPGRGAVGDAAWRDSETGRLVTRDLSIPFSTLRDTAQTLLGECGQAIRRLVAGLRMQDWPEGTRRALLLSLHPVFATAGAPLKGEALLAALREADGITFDGEGD